MAEQSERRLRALVRAFLSPGVWLVVAVESLPLALHALLPPAAGGTWRVMLVGLLLVALFYLRAGACRALSAGREVLTVPAVLAGGRPVFVDFLWLHVKLSVVVGLIIAAAVNAAALASGEELATVVERHAGTLPPVIAVLQYLFIFWLPWVFARRDFRLFATLKAAWHTGWRHGASAYLALLILAPALLLAALPAGAGLAAALILHAAGAFCGWVAYIYCSEWLGEQRAPGA